RDLRRVEGRLGHVHARRVITRKVPSSSPRGVGRSDRRGETGTAGSPSATMRAHAEERRTPTAGVRSFTGGPRKRGDHARVDNRSMSHGHVDSDLVAEVDRLAKTYADELVLFRRDLHAHPEPGREEVRTTRRIAERLAEAGLRTSVLPGGTGLLCDIGPDNPQVALRADIDALRVADEK